MILGACLAFLRPARLSFPTGERCLTLRTTMARPFFVYSNLEKFFSESDLGVAHEALRDWLWEQPQDAQKLLARLSPAGRAIMELLLARQIDRLRPQLLDVIQMDETQLAALSPQGKLGILHVPVFVLHGLNGRHYSFHRESLVATGNPCELFARGADIRLLFLTSTWTSTRHGTKT